MSDPLRTDVLRAASAAPEADRDAKIEQLLLAGLDQYFAAQFDHAISVWTRVLFLDRNHARARAYIERARSALAERQRESEELLQRGLAAFQRGDGAEARRLVQAAIDGGAPTDEALALRDRLDRLDTSAALDSPAPARRDRQGAMPREATLPVRWSALTVALMFVLVLAGTGAYSAAVWGPLDWPGLLPLQSLPARANGTTVAREIGVAPPRRGELALTRARVLAASGHLRDALTALDVVRPSDPQKAEADRFRGELQLQLIELTSIPAQPAAAANAASAPGARPVP